MAKVKYNAILNKFESVNSLQDTLDSENSTKGFDIEITHNDSIIGELSGNGSAGGDLSVLGGNSVSGAGGDLILAGGVGNILGGDTFLAGGVAVNGGDVFIDGGLSSSTDNLSGDVIIQNLKMPRTDGTNGNVIITDGAGNLSFSGAKVKATKLITSADSPYVVLSGDFTLRADTTSGAIIFNIPPTSETVGRVLNIKTINNTNNVTVSGDSSELIDGSNIFMLTSLFESITVQANGTNWDII